MRALWIAAVIGLTVFVSSSAGGPGVHGDAYGDLNVALFLMAAGLCLLRALLVSEQRLTWTLFGAGMLCWWGGEMTYAPNGPYPSISDALWIAYYVLALVALLAMMRSGLSHVRRRLWVDALVGALALATIAAALLVDPIIASTGGSSAEVVTNLAYPLLDVLIVGLLIGVFATTKGRPGRVWALLGIVFGVQAFVDTVYLYQVANGDYVAGTLLDATWPTLVLLVAFAAWHKPMVARSSTDHGWGKLGLTSSFAAVGLLVLIYDQTHEVGLTADILATLTVTFGFVSTVMTFGDKRALATGREMSRQQEHILDAAGEGIVGTDPAGIVTFVNPAGQRMTGYAPGELTGHSLHATVHRTRADGSPYPVEDSPLHASLQDGAIYVCDDDVYWRKDGTCFPVEYTSTPIVGDGRICGAVVVFHDITERREMERVKDEFTSIVSHELRTPLTSIRGSLGLLESGVLGPLPDRAQRMIQIAVQNTDRLVRLINDILDLERLDSDGMHLRESTCDAEQLIARAAEAMLSTAVAADVTLAVDAVPATFEADADRIIQTLTNLIGNAVKFSPPGGTVQISAQRRSDDILFTVRDGGRGIPADKLETIFGRFQQVDSSDARQSGGTGLGLAICRSIVECHGGRIWALSVPGEGSTFSFYVPAELDAAQQYTPRPSGARGSVLMCDDNAEILEVTGTALEEHGYRVILAHSGEQAVRLAISQRPDVILLDLLLPGMSGIETIGALQEHDETRAIPVVVLSVLSRSEHDLAFSALVDWIEKPASHDVLFAVLERALGPADETFRALLIEHDPAVAEILRALFARHGVASFAATDAAGAVELCKRVHPDVLLLDDDFPDIDDVDVRSWLRRHQSVSMLPIVSYDGGCVEDAERERQSVGTVAQILTKGQISAEEFQWRVMTLLARPHSQRPIPETNHASEAHSARR